MSMKKRVIVAVVSLAAGGGVCSGALPWTNGIEVLSGLGDIKSVSSTPTNLAVTFWSGGFNVFFDGRTQGGGTGRYAENNEPLILAHDKEVILYEQSGGVTLTPISFKDGEKGFRIRKQFVGNGRIMNTVAYVALGDRPVPRNRDDVEMIKEAERLGTGYPVGNGEWKKFEAEKEPPSVILFRPEPVQPIAVETPPEPPPVPPPEPVEAQAPVIEGGTPDIADGEDGQSEEKSETGNLWLYTLIPLFALFVILYFLRRKTVGR